MPDTAVIENEDALAADFDEAGEEEERPQTFAELGVPGPLVRVLAADGKKTAFPIQADTLPDSLAGRDILGRGRTGSGKTLAFSIPLVARLGEVDADEYENMSQFRHEVEQVRKGSGAPTISCRTRAAWCSLRPVSWPTRSTTC